MIRRFGDLDFPARLDDALAEGRLVVFAGAGVSVPAPTSLPTFDGLSARVGERADPRRENESFEVYLGRLESGGVRVDQIASQILSDPSSQPNDLHRAIVGLWRAAEDVRIVTTNFDHHFETVLHERWPTEPPELWAAPGLPVGSSFSGLVYLHGRLGRPSRLVLTDVGFGRAYLTEGWARRFLTALFQNYVVLFVGYSHRDTVLSYLARGLAPARDAFRFALTDEAKPDRWRLLGVEPISYDPEGDHVALLAALQGWGELRASGALEHRERITLCCTGQPPVSRQEADYLLWCLEHPNLAQFFARSAQGVEWIEWLHNEGRLVPLLSTSQASESQSILHYWLAREMCTSEASIERTLALLASPTVSISGPAFRALTDALWRRIEGVAGQPGAMDASTAKAILWLLPWRPANIQELALDLFLNSIPKEFPHLALAIFDELTRPFLRLDSRPFALRDDASSQVSVDVVVQADGHWIYQACEGAVQACLPNHSREVLVIARHHLESADRQLTAAGGGFSSILLSDLRESVANDGDEDERALRSRYPFYVLVDAARDAFGWLEEHQPTEAARTLLDWSASPSLLAQRIAMHGLSRTVAMSGDERLRLVVDRAWLDSRGVEPELSTLTASAYPAASLPERRLFLDQLRELRVSNLARSRLDDEQGRWEAQRYLSTLAWLRLHDSGCELLRERMAEAQTAYPELDARARERGPRIKTAWVRPVTRYSAEEMHGWSAEEFLRRFKAERSVGRSSWDTDPVQGFLEEGAKAVGANFEWGLALASELLEVDQAEPALWQYLLRGWQTARLPPELWRQVTMFLETHLGRLPVQGEIAELLERRTEGAPEEVPDEIVFDSIGLARAVWDVSCAAEPDGEFFIDWLTTAINRPAGKLAEFVVRSVSLLRQRHGDTWVDGAPGLRELLQEMAAKKASRTPLARVVLCSRLAFFHDLESSWSSSTLIPLFDWHDPDEARRSWSGFLVAGRPTKRLWPELKEMMRSTFDHLEGLGDKQERFAEFVAVGAMFFMEDGLDLPWLQAFLRAAPPQARDSFAHQTRRFLRDMELVATDRAWASWIRTYVAARLDGKPPLDEDEWASMQRWLIYLGEEFAEAVAVAAARPVRLPASSLIFHELAEKDPPPGPPLARARFLLHLLKGQERPFFEIDTVLAICRKIGATGDSALERQIQERFVELGGSGELFPTRS